MPHRMRSRRGLVASAAAVILLIMGFLFATAPNWRSIVTRESGREAPLSAPVADGTPAPSGAASAPGKPAAAVGQAGQPGSTEAGGQQASLPDATSSPQPSTAGPAAGQGPGAAAPADASGAVPSFDIVRVEPSGDSVIAARGSPNSDVVLLDGDVPIARAKTDASGQVALLPPALKPGEHNLTLSMTSGAGGSAVSSQSVAVSVPDQPKTAPLVALIQPNQPATILSGPVAGSPPAVGQTGAPPARASAVPAPAPASVVIRSVEVESLGSFYATGKAPPGTASRVYLNGAYVATVTADVFGNWSLKINKGMKPGKYAVRIDQTDRSGKVIARAEVPFDYPSQVASAAPRTETAKKNTTASGLAGVKGPITAPPAGSVGKPSSASATAGADPGGVAAGRNAARQDGTGPAGRSGRSDKGTVVAGLMGGSPTQSNVTPSPGASATLGSKPVGAVSPSGTGATPSSGAASTAGAAPAASGSAPSSVGGKPASAAHQTEAVVKGQKKVPTETVVASNEGGQVPKTSSMAVGSAGSTPGSGAEVASASAQPNASGDDAEADSSSPTVIAELITAKVIRGDSLWRISRQMLGHGVRYTQIYAANTQQIRDPKLIYPGQVFVLPTQ